MGIGSHDDVNEYGTFDVRFRNVIGGTDQKESLRNEDVLAMSTDFRWGEAESAERAVGYVGMEALGEFEGVEEKRPKQSSGQVVRR